MYLSKKNLKKLKELQDLLDMTIEELEQRFPETHMEDMGDWNWFLIGYINNFLKYIIEEVEIG